MSAATAVASASASEQKPVKPNTSSTFAVRTYTAFGPRCDERDFRIGLYAMSEKTRAIFNFIAQSKEEVSAADLQAGGLWNGRNISSLACRLNEQFRDSVWLSLIRDTGLEQARKLWDSHGVLSSGFHVSTTGWNRPERCKTLYLDRDFKNGWRTTPGRNAWAEVNRQLRWSGRDECANHADFARAYAELGLK